jgi:hypothetical protein
MHSKIPRRKWKCVDTRKEGRERERERESEREREERKVV